MTHTQRLELAFLKTASLAERLTAPFLTRPGFSALRAARQQFDVTKVAPTVKEILQGTRGEYQPWNMTARLLNGEATADTARHETIHGYQHVMSDFNPSPLARFGAPGMGERNTGSLIGGLRDAALELDARIGAKRNIPAAITDLVQNAPAYAARFEGLGKLPYSALGLIGKIL